MNAPRAPLTDRGDVSNHEVSSLGHDGLQAHTLQTGGEFGALVLHRGRQLLEVALRSPIHLVFSLKSTSDCLLMRTGMEEYKRVSKGVSEAEMTFVIYCM